jgi:hypothetical protein
MASFRRALVFAAFVSAASVSSPSTAGFFIPKGTTMVMGTFSPDEQNYEIAYGFDRRVSGSVGLTRVKEGEAGAAWRNVAMAQFAYLIHRQPTADGIFNAYVWAGPIAERLENRDPAATEKAMRSKHTVEPTPSSPTRYGAQGGLWVDFETRLIYTRIKAHAFKTEGWRRNEVVAQAMLAPYAADYEDIAAWGGVQVKRVSGDKTEITPYVRFFQRNWWIDAGISVDRTHRDNFFLNVSYTF